MGSDNWSEFCPARSAWLKTERKRLHAHYRQKYPGLHATTYHRIVEKRLGCR